MKKLILYLFVILTLSGYGQKGMISAADLKRDVTFLASDSLKGRKSGTPEINVAGSYILNRFLEAGLIPLGENGFQYFEIVTNVTLGSGNYLEFSSGSFSIKEDFVPLSFSTNGTVKAPVIFAGFGFDLNLDSLKWNDYQQMDVTGTWVMVFRGDPEPDLSDSKFIPFSDIRTKILTAKDKGAAGVLLITPKSVDKEDKLMPLIVENNEVTSGIPVINIRRDLADRLLGKKGSTDSLEKAIIRDKMPHSFTTSIILTGATDVVQHRERTFNVIALLPGRDSILRDEYLVVGAHYDHLGLGGPGSGSRMPDTNAVHNGADDNASGTALIMELADLLSQESKMVRRSIIFIAFSGEEIGLLGSKFFVNHPAVPLSKIKGMFNFDMVGRFDPEKNSISVSGTGTSVEADTILRIYESSLPFKVIHAPDGYGPSDHAAFYAAGIPVFYFNTGVHIDYHTPFDDTEKLDFKTEAEIGDFAASVIREVDGMNQSLAFRESGKRDGTGRGGRRLKVTLGIMPDFAGTEKKGLRVDGVTKEGPADKGGMRKGDIIISVNGMKVENIYEYMSRLQKLRQGQTISVEVIREEKIVVLIIQL